jgi:hypothetical protein
MSPSRALARSQPNRPALRGVDEVYFFTFDGDRIARVWGIDDTLDRFEQLGLEPNER